MIIMTRFCRCSGLRGWGEAADQIVCGDRCSKRGQTGCALYMGAGDREHD
jgi:hypothetical protein